MSYDRAATVGEGVLVHAEDLDMNVIEVRRRWPLAVEYVGLDSRPCWRLADLGTSVAQDIGEGRR